jgi:arylsulfatase
VWEGTNILKMLRGECAKREYLVGMIEIPGAQDFKVMVATDEWKYIFHGKRRVGTTFQLRQDPNELSTCVTSASKMTNELHALAVRACQAPGTADALDSDKLSAFPFRERPRIRIYQFDRSCGAVGFPLQTQDALKGFDSATLKRVK